MSEKKKGSTKLVIGLVSIFVTILIVISGVSYQYGYETSTHKTKQKMNDEQIEDLKDKFEKLQEKLDDLKEGQAETKTDISTVKVQLIGISRQIRSITKKLKIASGAINENMVER